MTRKILLTCGVAASALYIVADVLGAMHFSGYSYTAQTISELSAIDAPSRSLIIPLYILYDALLLAFAVGVWQIAIQSRALQITALMLIGIAIVGVAWGPFFPMHLRGVLAAGGKTLTDTMHIVGANVTVPLILLAIGFGSAAFSKRFRVYSIATILVLIICGVLTWVQAPQLAANLPTPWMGVFERINVFGFMLWNAVLAMMLLRGQRTVHAAAPVPKAAWKVDTRNRLYSPVKWSAGAVGCATAAYATYVGVAWVRYGRSDPPKPYDADSLLDRFMPTFEVAERRHIFVAAPAELTFTAACEGDLLQSPIIRAIFRTRELILGSQRDSAEHPRGVVAFTKSIGWSVLAEVPGREIVMGTVTQPWNPNVVFRRVTPEEFVTFSEPDYVKIAWTLRAHPIGNHDSIFRHETRVITTDPTGRAKFRRYWACFSPGIKLIRWLLLPKVRAQAEATFQLDRASQTTTPMPDVVAEVRSDHFRDMATRRAVLPNGRARFT